MPPSGHVLLTPVEELILRSSQSTKHCVKCRTKMGLRIPTEIRDVFLVIMPSMPSFFVIHRIFFIHGAIEYTVRMELWNNNRHVTPAAGNALFGGVSEK